MVPCRPSYSRGLNMAHNASLNRHVSIQMTHNILKFFLYPNHPANPCFLGAVELKPHCTDFKSYRVCSQMFVIVSGCCRYLAYPNRIDAKLITNILYMVLRLP